VVEPLAGSMRSNDEFLNLRWRSLVASRPRFSCAPRDAPLSDDFAAGRSPAGRLWLPRTESFSGSAIWRLTSSRSMPGLRSGRWGRAYHANTGPGRFVGGVEEFRAMYSDRCAAVSLVSLHGLVP